MRIQMMLKNQNSLAGKLNLAKPYPARDEKTRLVRVLTAETKNVLKR
jgi:hypothetical protein